ncbi:hypothetical protein AURANDRAFT_68184 [Aureococcus anophagefferens]|uniref:Uncharacterized protein n=1 Tax=Aureococcus anophagefferens TaxID=44056 RepID=F0YNS3_AURAN|nr:hypothetical protein AURANDRAFT_68184 [Aureococcus anophagefferens]EGB03242.1 hypothetical protein AURANDRAFT_68184 [Aureococcus anophagefferens]|eukprot:XP_009042067.1 hypothetical protein AURANDRAFT_68184 [Aureococcus anophagefferens]
MNPVCKVICVSVGLLFGLIFAMMIPANVGKFAKEIVRSGLRQGKIGDSVARRAAFDDAILKMNYGMAFGGAPSFSGVPSAYTPGCVAASNWTSCSCFIGGLPDFAWQAIPDKLNADKEIMVILRVYAKSGVQVLQAGLDINGWMIDFGGAGVPGAFHNPAYLASPPTTSFAKTWCVSSYTVKECWTLYIGEDMETSAAIMAPVGAIIMAVLFFGIDLLVFMVLFLMAGSGSKVGPAK